MAGRKDLAYAAVCHSEIPSSAGSGPELHWRSTLQSSTKGAEAVIQEAFARTPGQIGFKSRTRLDESPETKRKTSLAVRRAQEGDQEALRYLYTTYSDNVYGYVRSIVRDDRTWRSATARICA